MISAFTNTWKIPELRDRILFTLALIVIIRLGVHITIPGVDATVIKEWLDGLKNQDPKTGGGITALLTVFSGGGLQQAGIFALGIMPYISASIMVQLMTAVVPKLSRLAREDGGRQKSQHQRTDHSLSFPEFFGFQPRAKISSINPYSVGSSAS